MQAETSQSPNGQQRADISYFPPLPLLLPVPLPPPFPLLLLAAYPWPRGLLLTLLFLLLLATVAARTVATGLLPAP